VLQSKDMVSSLSSEYCAGVEVQPTIFCRNLSFLNRCFTSVLVDRTTIIFLRKQIDACTHTVKCRDEDIKFQIQECATMKDKMRIERERADDRIKEITRRASKTERELDETRSQLTREKERCSHLSEMVKIIESERETLVQGWTEFNAAL
jgi:chromosome segregation ATPase